MQVQGSTETYTPVTLNQKGADIDFSSKDLTLSIAMFSDRFVKPLIASVANTIDADGLALYNQVYQSVGVPGTTPNTMDVWLDGGVKLDNAAAPNDGERNAVLNPVAQARLVSNLKGLFNDTSEIAKTVPRRHDGPDGWV